MNIAVVLIVSFVIFAMTNVHSAESDFVLHNCFYTNDTKTGKLIKLPLTAKQTATFKKLVAGKFTEIDEEKYWRSYGRFMICPAPQGYIGWENKSYWVVMLPDVDANHKYVGDAIGLHVIEFTNGKMRHLWQAIKVDEDGDPVESLARTPTDWRLDGDGKERQLPISDAEEKRIKQNIDWTDAVHQRMQKKFPPKTQWKD